MLAGCSGMMPGDIQEVQVDSLDGISLSQVPLNLLPGKFKVGHEMVASMHGWIVGCLDALV